MLATAVEVAATQVAIKLTKATISAYLARRALRSAATSRASRAAGSTTLSEILGTGLGGIMGGPLLGKPDWRFNNNVLLPEGQWLSRFFYIC